MGATQLLVPFLVTWFCIHAFLFLLQRFLNRPNLPVGPGSGPDYELLPTTTTTQSASPPSPASSPKPGTTSKSGSSSGLLVKPFYVRFSTTGLNSFFFRLGNSPKLARFWRVWYNLGVVFAMLAMVLGWALMLFAAIKLVTLAVSFLLTLSPLGSQGSSSSDPGQPIDPIIVRSAPLKHFRKRNLGDDSHAVSSSVTSFTPANSAENDMVFVPVIPGVTLPLSHLPYYLIALLVSGTFHEAGHAIAAAREKTQVSSTGVFLYILYPGAFVDISPRVLAIMSPLQQLRVICAGVWHNAVFFSAAWIFLSSGALQLSFKLIGWKHMTDGLSVVDVASASPLFDHLVPGNVMTKVDDISLNGNPLEIWSTALLPTSASDQEKTLAELDSGFCIPNTLLFGKFGVFCGTLLGAKTVTKVVPILLQLIVQPSDCCLFTPQMPFGHSKDTSLSCFTPFNPGHTTPIPNNDSEERVLADRGQCLPSFDILAHPNPTRCTTLEPTCGQDSTCYRPFTAYRTGSMIRLYYTMPAWMERKEVDGIYDNKQKVASATGEHVVLYQGDPKDIWEAVQVTTMTSRWSFLPLWLPNAILLTIRYTMSFSLALSVLNIVPARHLDGHHALKSFLALIVSIRQSYKSTLSIRESMVECLIDSGSASALASSSITTATFTKGSKVVKGIVVSTTVLLGWVMIGSLVQMTAIFFWE
ncbi:hypothetical protein BGX26_009399 [Mortierella sp. AD094]|nr:hypothetical protein BGX26_009399 [Mortierella sp. AD094]